MEKLPDHNLITKLLHVFGTNYVKTCTGRLNDKNTKEKCFRILLSNLITDCPTLFPIREYYEAYYYNLLLEMQNLGKVGPDYVIGTIH